MNRKCSRKLTKNDMARVIICALYNMPELPLADDKRVIRQVRRRTRDNLLDLHGKALAVLS